MEPSNYEEEVHKSIINLISSPLNGIYQISKTCIENYTSPGKFRMILVLLEEIDARLKTNFVLDKTLTTNFIQDKTITKEDAHG
jgi:hypothetical protein